MSNSIIVVEDEAEIADLLELYLSNDGFAVCKFNNAADALESIEADHPDLVLLDIMLPDADGFSVCRKIREKYFFPIIMLTARTGDDDKIKGLTVGADDYITKPFNPLEVTARVKTQLRRCMQYSGAAAPKQIDEYDIRGLVINRANHKCALYGKEISLTPLEFSILWYLCENMGRVVSSEELFEKVWGERYLDSNNTVMAHIARLREKLNEPVRKPKFIKTVWGVGYTVEK